MSLGQSSRCLHQLLRLVAVNGRDQGIAVRKVAIERADPDTGRLGNILPRRWVQLPEAKTRLRKSKLTGKRKLSNKSLSFMRLKVFSSSAASGKASR